MRAPSGSTPSAHLATSPLRFARIIVGIDFTDSSLGALGIAIKLATLFTSELFLVHAVTPLTLATELEPVTPKGLRAELDRVKEEMNWLVHHESKLRTLQYRTVVASSDAEELIDKVALAEEADLIVVGSNRLRHMELPTLGSVAGAVLRKAACPVLVVGPGCHRKLDTLRKIVFATNLKTTGLRAAQYSTSLAERGDGRLTLLHIVEDSQVSKTNQEVIEGELQALLPDRLALSSGTNVRVEFGHPAEMIPSILESEEATLLVVGLGDQLQCKALAPHSILPAVIREARCPVLVIRNHFALYQHPLASFGGGRTLQSAIPWPVKAM